MADRSPNPPAGGDDRSDPDIPDGLTARQHAAVTALLTERTHQDAAAKAGVSEATVRRWLASDTAFRSTYLAARRQVMDGVVTRLQQAAVLAVDALERNLTCGKPGCEIQAAVAVLDHAAKGLELADLAERLEALEQSLASKA